MNEILITTVISSICTGGITWLFTLKYTRKQAEADAMLSVQNVYQQIIEDLKTDRVELKENIKELADKICYLIENENVRIKMGHKARENVKRFLPENVMPQWKNLFESLTYSSK